MKISSSYNQYSLPVTKNYAASRFITEKNNRNSFESIMDKVTISFEAMGKSVSNKRSLTDVAADLKEYHRKAHEQPEEISTNYNYDAWLPQNLGKYHKICDEIEKFKAAIDYDPVTVSDADAEKLWNLCCQIRVLAVYGESQVVTDEMMDVGVKAYQKAEADWGRANGYDVAEWTYRGEKPPISIVNTYLKLVYGDPEETKEKLEEEVEDLKNKLITKADTPPDKEETKETDGWI